MISGTFADVEVWEEKRGEDDYICLKQQGVSGIISLPKEYLKEFIDFLVESHDKETGKDVVESKIKDLEALPSYRFGEWEQGFLASISKMVVEGKVSKLSGKQIGIINRLHLEKVENDLN